MKKIWLLLILAFISLCMISCGPDSMNPNATLPGSIELLFDMPSDVEVVSEEFVFEMDIDSYNHFCYSPPMLLTATYNIKNNGENQNIYVGLPLISSLSGYEDKIAQIELYVNEEKLNFEPQVAPTALETDKFNEINYTYFDSMTDSSDDYNYEDIILRYEFDAPKEELDETASFTTNQNTKILVNGDFTNINGTLYFSNSEESDTIVAYSFYEDLIIDFNYEANVSMSEIHFDALAAETAEEEPYRLILKHSILEFLQSDMTYISVSYIMSYNFTGITEYGTNLLFFNTKSISLEGNGAVTSIELIYPFWASYHKTDQIINRYALEYNFYFDDLRYQSALIDLTIMIISEYTFDDFVFENEESNSLVFNPKDNNHLQFKTIN